MPVQNTEESFIAFGYLSDFRHVIVDGGNIVHCGSKAIMTAKVFEENPWMDAEELCRLLRTRLDAERFRRILKARFKNVAELHYKGCLNCASWTIFDPKEDLPF